MYTYQVVEKPKHRAAARIKCLPSSWRTLGRSLGRKNRASVARNALKDTGIRQHVLKYLSKDVQKELSVLCSKKVQSVFRIHSPGNTLLQCTYHYHGLLLPELPFFMLLEMLERFKWEDVATELTARAPTLHSVLKMCVEVKRRERPHKRSYRNSDVSVMGVCASVILRHKNQHMNALQNIISLLLHRGHAGKQVIMIYRVLINYMYYD